MTPVSRSLESMAPSLKADHKQNFVRCSWAAANRSVMALLGGSSVNAMGNSAPQDKFVLNEGIAADPENRFR